MRKLVALLLCATLFGCSGTDTRTFKNLSTKSAESRLGATIIADKPGEKVEMCPSEQVAAKKEGAILLAPLVAAGASLAATFVVDAINKSIEEYKKGLAGTFGVSGA